MKTRSLKLNQEFRRMNKGMMMIKTIEGTYTYPNRPRASSSMAIGPRTSQARSLRSDRACVWLGRWLGRYVATELEPNSVATYRPSTYTTWSLRSDWALPKRRYDTNPCILVYSLNAISRRPWLNHSMFPVKRRHQSNLTIKIAGSLLLSKKP
ncbi:hypothetical protein DY000_02022651 [Brassica cretica]|uniref:Uncharacterized protein n=1 Tax=Brassica cretica TaxID=69181 RepID=A0ABQ7EIZ1_BRACR|nr:hypothetical protein DY000_02022651 [Brassica cretica]